MLKFLLRALLASVLACAPWAYATGACATAAGATGAGADPARPLTLDDVLRMESFGAASLSPDGRWAVFERRAPYEDLPRYDLGHRSVWAGSRLWIADLNTRAPAAPLLPHGEGTGVILGGWSPSGTQLLVFRLRGRTWEAGVVRLADRSVRWTGLTPDLPLTGAAFAWRDERRLLLTTRPDGGLPWPLAYDGDSQIKTVALWREAEAGRLSKVAFDTQAGVLSGADAPDRRLIELDTLTGAVRPLSQGAVQDFALSPDGAFAAVVTGAAPVPVSPDQVVQMDLARRGRLTLVDLAGGPTIALDAPLDVAPHLLRWSADGARLLIWVRADGEDWRAGGLASVTRDGQVAWRARGALDPLPAGATIDQLRGVAADWLGETPLLYARDGAGDRFDWFALEPGGPRILTAALRRPPGRLSAAPDGQVLLVGDGSVWRVRDGGVAEPVGERGGYVDAGFNDLQKPVRLRSNEAPRRAAAWAEAGGVLTSVEPHGPHAIGPIGEGGRVAAVGDRSALVLTARQGVAALDLLRDGQSRRLAALNTEFASRTLSQPVAVEHRDRLDRPARSWLFVPADRPLDRARGLIVMPYPGALDSGRIQDPFSLVYGARAALLASQGFAVLSPFLPIDTPEGLSIDEIGRGVGLALDAALAAYPALPADRVGLLGHSHGGYLVLGMAARSSRYRAIISWAGMSDLAGEWGEFTPVSRTAPVEFATLRQQSGWVETGQGEIDGPPYRDPDAYVAASPYYEADRIQAPVLLITADRDFVPISQSERIFSAINREGGRARLVTYWGEGHFNWSPANIRDIYREIDSWFDEAFTGSSVATTRAGPRLLEP